MEKKTVSIIIPVYNVEDYIVECLSSISAQTYQGEIECILVDDCSTDKSVEVIRNFIKEDRSKVEYRVILQNKNQRQGIARNVGLKHAKGDYILFVDSDDVISHNCLDVMFNEVEKHPDVDYVLCSMTDMDGHTSFSPQDYPSYVCDKKWLMRKSLFPEGGISQGPVNKLIKKSLILENNIYFPGKVIYEDVQFSFLLGIFAQSACFSTARTYFYRTNREGSTVTTTAKNLEFGLESRITLMHNMIECTTQDNNEIQNNALLARFLLYLKITKGPILNKYDGDLRKVKLHLCRKMPFSFGKAMTYLPLFILKNKFVNTILYKFLKTV